MVAVDLDELAGADGGGGEAGAHHAGQAVLAADDGGDPSRNQALTQQLVEQDHVVAFVYNDGPLASEGGAQYLVQHHIPAIGTGGLEPFYKEHPQRVDLTQAKRAAKTRLRDR